MGCSSSNSFVAKGPESSNGQRGGSSQRTDSATDTPTQRKMERSNSICSVSSEMSLSQVAAGHGGVSILRYVSETDSDPERPRCVMKEFDDREVAVYKELAETNDELRPFAAEFFGEVEDDRIPQDLEGCRYMKLTNLLKDFGVDPHVMDCKLGIRSYVEEEARNKKLRKDLYTKMKKIDENAPTKEEHEAQACTKYRWMSFNDSITTTLSLGVRIDGISNADGSVNKSHFKLLESIEDMSSCIITHFFRRHDRQYACAAAASVLKRLKDIRKAFMASSFASRHSFVGMSLLFILERDGSSAGVYLIDFAKTFPLPEGIHIDHTSPWIPGNYEDGIITGLDNLIMCWGQTLAELTSGTLVADISELARMQKCVEIEV